MYTVHNTEALYGLSQVKISTVDQRSVSSADRVNGVRVKVTQLRAPREEHEHSGARGRADIHRQGGGTAAEVATQTITYALPEDGRLPIQFHIQEEVEKIIIQVCATGLKHPTNK